MSLPNIPNINPEITLEIEDSIKLLLSSIAMQEIGLSHIVNAEGENLQCIIKRVEADFAACENGNLCSEECTGKCSYDKIQGSEILLKFNDSINETIKNVFRSQSLLQLKLEDVKELYKMIDIKQRANCSEFSSMKLDKEYKLEKRYKALNEDDGCIEEEAMEVSCKPIYIDRG